MSINPRKMTMTYATSEFLVSTVLESGCLTTASKMTTIRDNDIDLRGLRS